MPLTNGDWRRLDSKGRDPFIVDNRVSGWTGLRYLEERSSIAKAPKRSVSTPGRATP